MSRSDPLTWTATGDGDCQSRGLHLRAFVPDDCALTEAVLPPTASRAMQKFARQLAADLDYDDIDCSGPEQDHHAGHPPDPMPAPEGEPCGYELRHLEAVRRRWPEAVHLFRGRGVWRRWTIVWPGTVRTTVNLAERQTSVDRGGISFSTAAPASWFGREGPAAMVRDLDRALFEHRVPWLLWVPPSVDPWRTWDGEARYGETWLGDADHVVYVDHGSGVVGCSAWSPLTGRSVGAFPTAKDCDAPRCALSGPYYTPCTYADCDLDLGGGCVLRGPA